MFDPRRQAILLLGGSKEGNWTNWYTTAMPAAEQPYDEYLNELTTEGILDTPTRHRLKGR